MLTIDKLTATLDSFNFGPLTLTIERGDYFVLLGPSGVGKSVLLELLAGMIAPRTGTITLAGREITHESISRRGMGLVFQKPALFPHLTVESNIAYGLKGRGLTRAEIHGRVRELAVRLEILPLLQRRPGTLSGGEAQRVSLARMLAVAPEVLLLDEPLSSLDKELRDGLKGVLRKLWREGQTILHVTHDFEEAFSLATRVGILERGDGGVSRLTQVGPPEEVFENPSSGFVARFMGLKNIIVGKLPSQVGVTSGDEGLRTFLPDDPDGPGIQVSTTTPWEGRCFIVIPQSAILCAREPFTSSLQNMLQGVVVDMAPTQAGVEVVVDCGVTLCAVLSRASVTTMKITVGERLWVGFKASAVRIMGEMSSWTIQEPADEST